jgi:hypothetical protein
MSALKELAELEFKARYQDKPNFPENAKFRKKYTDKTANGLTKAVVDFLNLSGHQAERTSITGRMIDKRKVVRNCVGQVYQIGSAQWIPSSGQKGSADVSATIRGRSIKIEIKIAMDRQSIFQKQYQEQIEKAGGLYWIVKDFQGFIELYNDITD